MAHGDSGSAPKGQYTERCTAPVPHKHGNSMPAAKSTATKRLQAGVRGPRLRDRQRWFTSDQE
eukprot:2578363-Pyramimonas_sp.AAC.1